MAELDTSLREEVAALTREAVIDKIRRAPLGSRITFHSGLLAEDREKDMILDEAAKTYAELAELGAVLLTQRRAQEGRFDYIAIRTREARR